MKKTVFNIFQVLITTTIISSCTKVIDVDLNKANPKIVVDASVNFVDTNNRYAIVKLSWTGSFYSSNDFSKINGADLYLKTPDGKVHSLVNNADGEYISTDHINGGSLDNFELSGKIEDIEISSISSMPKRVDIDSIGAYVLPFGPPNEANLKTPIVFFTDLADEKNYYRFRLTINNEYVSELFFSRDDGQNGEQIAFPFMGFMVDIGDTVKIDLLNIDKESFDYYKVLNQNIGSGGFGAAPGNPNTNIQGDAIGIFTAQQVSTKTMIVK